jgi:hypothetical protein
VFSKSAVGIGPAHTHPAQVNSHNMERKPPSKEVVFSFYLMLLVNEETALELEKFSDSLRIFQISFSEHNEIIVLYN